MVGRQARREVCLAYPQVWPSGNKFDCDSASIVHDDRFSRTRSHRRRDSHGSDRDSARRRQRARDRDRISRNGDDAYDYNHDQEDDIDESMLTPDERAYREAHRVAEQKVRLWSKFWRMAIIGVPLLIFVPWVGAIALCFMGINLSRRAYREYPTTHGGKSRQ